MFQDLQGLSSTVWMLSGNGVTYFLIPASLESEPLGRSNHSWMETMVIAQLSSPVCIVAVCHFHNLGLRTEAKTQLIQYGYCIL